MLLLLYWMYVRHLLFMSGESWQMPFVFVSLGMSDLLVWIVFFTTKLCHANASSIYTEECTLIVLSVSALCSTFTMYARRNLDECSRKIKVSCKMKILNKKISNKIIVLQETWYHCATVQPSLGFEVHRTICLCLYCLRCVRFSCLNYLLLHQVMIC
jgi:hypothetical protein